MFLLEIRPDRSLKIRDTLVQFYLPFFLGIGIAFFPPAGFLPAPFFLPKGGAAPGNAGFFEAIRDFLLLVEGSYMPGVSASGSMSGSHIA